MQKLFSKKYSDPPPKLYRFLIGTPVLCRTGAQEWSPGMIVALDYSEPGWPRGRTVPYQVQLDDGPLIFVPQDNDMLCRKLTLPFWGSILAKGPSPSTAKELGEACRGNDVNERNHKGRTALLDAIKMDWIEGVQVLIKSGANPNVVDNQEVSALHEAYHHGAPMIGVLLKAGASPNHQDLNPDQDPDYSSTKFADRTEHRTPLHYCCCEGDLESAKLLIQGNADMNIQDGDYKTALHLAIEEDNDDVIDLLLQSGAAVDLCSIESGMKNTPLMEAAHKGKHALAKKLIRAGAEVNKVGKQDMTALHLAARRGDPKTVKILLDAKADATLESQIGTAQSLASKKGSAELLQLLGVKEEDVMQKKAPLDAATRAALFMD